jgi:RES domain-containing protein
MRAFRLTRRAHHSVALQGVGAKRYGGRWNSPGIAAGYAAESLELAVLEMLVHTDLDLVPRDMVSLEIDIPPRLITTLQRAGLPARWSDPPPYRAATQALGDRWISSGTSLALRVPSAVLPQRANLVINPAHPAFAQIRTVEVQDFHWPPRLVAGIRRD